jgi:CRP/FNR family transcriptional regulator
MSRRDIGSYLGLSLETVSRVLTALAEAGMVHVESRAITILNRPALHAVARGGARKKRSDGVQRNQMRHDADVTFPTGDALADHPMRIADHAQFVG